MSLIDTSYFVGPLTIAQLGHPPLDSNVNLFINRAEPKFLQAVLGYDLWSDFMDGLSQPVIDQKWLDLRDGAQFTTVSNWPAWFWGFTGFNRYYWMNSRRTARWVGFCTAGAFSANTSLGPDLVLKTGSGAGFPVTGTNAFTLARLAGAQFTIERRGVGTMILGLDYSLSNNNQTITLLSAGDTFGPGEIFILHFSQIVNGGPVSQSYVSPIAGYVYYLWVRDQQTSQAGSGTVKSQNENSVSANPSWRMADAWNQMSEDIFILWQFLQAQGTDVYASYDMTKIDYLFCKPLNIFNI